MATESERESTDLSFFTIWELSHSEEREAVEELPELKQKKNMKV